ncbi:MAG: RluA family pseudouridine synthase [Thermotogae bacterium]|nr:RluA family pseudouridine synthase [Thermotogota bacterium]
MKILTGKELFSEDIVSHEIRLDRFLRKKYPQIKLASIYKLIRKGWVRVNGKRKYNPGLRLKKGDRVRVAYTGEIDHMLRTFENKATPKYMKLRIVYENEKIVVLNKQPGVSVHPGGVSATTLVEGLMYYGERKGFQPYLVHRLDRETSGVLIAAKDPETAKKLSFLFSHHMVKKEYISLIKGHLKDEIEISQPIEGREAKTWFKPMRYFRKADATLVTINIKTGRKHQIRRHAAFMDHPVVMDDLYGDREYNRRFRKLYGLNRLFLHCRCISFDDIPDIDRKVFEVPLPEDLMRILEILGEER